MNRFTAFFLRSKPPVDAGSRRQAQRQDETPLSETAYQRLFENVVDGVYRSTPEGTIVAANPALLKLLGYDSEEELRHLDVARDLYVDPQKRTAWAQKLKRDNQVRNFETVLKRKDGRRIVVLDNAYSALDEQGKVLYYEGTLTNITGRKQAEEIQSVLLSISQAASAAKNLRELLQTIHQELGRLIDTSNFYVALYDERTALYSFPYHVDKYEAEDQPPQALSKSLTDYARRTSQALLVDEQVHEQLIRDGEVELVGVASPVWMGVPLKTGEKVIGVVAVQSYEESSLYSSEDLELLTFVSENIALAVERTRAQEALRNSERRFRDLFEASPDAIFVEDLAGHVLDVNPAACALQRIAREDLIGMNVSELVPPEHVEEALVDFKRLVRGEVERVEGFTWTADGSAIPVEVSVGPLEYEGEQALLVQVRDITERKEHEKQLNYLAQFDVLTGLANRSLLEDRLGQALMAAKRSGEPVALHYLDLDEFKDINDTLGHATGDELLKKAADRLSDLMRDSDSLARLGGDEFAIIQPGVDGATGASALALRTLDAMSEPFSVAGHEIHTSTSIGISLSSPETDPEELMQQADRALYRAKQKGRQTFHFHNEELAEEVSTYVTLRQDLYGAIERGEFFLEYQPQIDLGSGGLVGREALVRWRHPRRGLLAPGAFIPATENTGLIVPLGAWVLEQACQQCKAWCDGGQPELSVAVNISAVQFRDPRFAEKLLRVLRETGIDPQLLELELIESILMEGSDGVHQALLQWNEHGIKISIDDFGTGYSSLQYLREFPVHKLKVAMEFVQGVTDDPDDASIVDAVIGLGHKLGLKVIAEGVESEEQAEFLRAHDCDEAQGFYFGRPVAADAMLEQLLPHPTP